MKHIVHTTTKLIDGGGADLNIFYSIYNLTDHYKFSLIVGTEHSVDLINKLKENGVTIYVIPELQREVNFFRDIKVLKKIKNILKHNSVDVIYTHNAKTGILGRFAAKLSNIPIIIHGVHGMSFTDNMPIYKKIIFKNSEKLVGNFTDIFVCVGEVIKNKMIEAGVGEPDKYQVINSGMFLERFSEVKVDKELMLNLNIEPNEVIFTVVGRLDKRKGQHLFLEAFSELKKIHPSAKAMLVGSGPEESYLRDLVKKFGIQENVIFTGFQPDVEKYLKISDVICLTSEWEGIPQVLVQAAAVGKPAISFDVDGVSEVITNADNGFLIEYGDISTLREKMEILYTNQMLREEMGANSRLKIDDRWSMETMTRKNHSLYKSLFNG